MSFPESLKFDTLTIHPYRVTFFLLLPLTFYYLNIIGLTLYYPVLACKDISLYL